MLSAGWVMWLLVILSIIGLAVVIERAYFFLSSRDDIAKLKHDLLKLLDGGDLDAARKRLAESKSFEARVAEAGLAAADNGPASAEENMVGAAMLAKLSMEKNLAFLGTVGNNAPFVGLLGTVIGIIRAFSELDQSEGRVSAGLMAEIGEALVATAIGILVAIPSVAAFNFLQRVVKSRITRAEALGKDVLAFLKAEPSGADSKESGR